MEYMRNTHKYSQYKNKMRRNKEHRPNGAAAEGCATCSSIFLYCEYLWYIPYIFLRYSMYIYIYISQISSIYFPLCVSQFMESRVALDMSK